MRFMVVGKKGMDEYSGEIFIFYFVDAKNKISRL